MSRGDRVGRTNDTSIVSRIDYGETSFIITVDAEDWSEYMMIDAGVPLKADVLRVSHHGSNTGATREFLQAIQPEYAVISVGKNNGYGYPHTKILERLTDARFSMLRTDELGTIIMKSDGKAITVRWTTLLQ